MHKKSKEQQQDYWHNRSSRTAGLLHHRLCKWSRLCRQKPLTGPLLTQILWHFLCLMHMKSTWCSSTDLAATPLCPSPSSALATDWWRSETCNTSWQTKNPPPKRWAGPIPAFQNRASFPVQKFKDLPCLDWYGWCHYQPGLISSWASVLSKNLPMQTFMQGCTKARRCFKYTWNPKSLKKQSPQKTPEGLKNRSSNKKHGIDIHALLEFTEFSLFVETRGKKRKTSYKGNKVGNRRVGV